MCPIGQLAWLQKLIYISLIHFHLSIVLLNSITQTLMRTHKQSHTCLTALSTQHIITNYRHYKLKKPNMVSWLNSVTLLFFFLLASYLINLNVTDLSCCR